MIKVIDLSGFLQKLLSNLKAWGNYISIYVKWLNKIDEQCNDAINRIRIIEKGVVETIIYPSLFF